MCDGFDLVAIEHRFSFHWAGGLKSSVRINAIPTRQTGRGRPRGKRAMVLSGGVIGAAWHRAFTIASG